MKNLVSVVGCGFVLSLTTIGTASAQNEYFSRDKYTAVMERQQPDFDPIPMRLGAFSVRSFAEAGAEYETNVFAEEEDEDSDTVISLAAGARATSNWSRHRLSVFGDTRYNEYLDFSDNSAADTTVGADGQVDVTREFFVTPRVRYSEIVENRGDFVGAQGIAEPVSYTRAIAGVDANYHTGRLRLLAGVEVRENDFDDVDLLATTGQLDQDFRDETTTTARARATYALTPNFAVFGEATQSEVDYEQTVLIDSIERNRDRDETAYRIGADFELTALVRGQVGIGYFESDIEDDFFNDSDGLSVDSRVTWFPSRITNVIFTARRGIVDYGLQNAASAVQTSYGATVVHELRRNILLSAGAGVREEEYDDIDRNDDRLELNASATYKLNRNVHFRGFARHISRDTSGLDAGSGRTFDNQIIGVAVRIFP